MFLTFLRSIVSTNCKNDSVRIDHRHRTDEGGGNVAEEPTSGVSFRRSNELELLINWLGNVQLLRAVAHILNHFDVAERSDHEELIKPDVPKAL